MRDPELRLWPKNVHVRVRASRRAGGDGTLVTIHDRGSGIPQGRTRANVRSILHDQRAERLGAWSMVSKTLIMKQHGTIRYRTSTRDCGSGTTFQSSFPPMPLIRPQEQTPTSESSYTATSSFTMCFLSKHYFS